ncbi:ATP-binding protein [Hanamia caeni]|uniref:ATP-binding protein n=1 Tax=Hanamia caeni TaxID=2294116 RepID=A0A3M9N7U3_9BACT|nr:ATP-binding protein [Hanamia caeni]RNI33806.1 ATP-binding protein [Hanamia caeni]
MATQYSAEFTYLFDLIQHRVNKAINQNYNEAEPSMPAYSKWNKNLSSFVSNNELDKNSALLLLIALAPYVHPHLFDDATGDLLSNNNFPKIGGTHGKNFRGFLPTGETAVFIIGGDNPKKRSDVQRLFQADHIFADKKILWLETLPDGEPPLHGRIIISQDYINLMINGRYATPHFSMSFPAKRISTRLTWDDLIISDELRQQISELENWLSYNDQLVDEWNMADRFKRGYRALFYGPSGTGKTFTAGLIGNEFNKEVYKIDLSMVVSKYIGETEKNLELLFARAEDKGWILFFDEADALFGKRTNVKDAHDKYANQEVSYLLQRIEDFNGLIILATNMKNNIDDAFIRRFNAILKFPLPDADQRAEIWKSSFPKNIRFLKKHIPYKSSSGAINDEQREEVNIPEQVKKYQLTGGSINNIVQYASIKGLEKYTQDKAIAEDLKKNTSLVTSESNDDNQFVDLDEEANAIPEMTIYLTDVLDGIKKELLKEGKPFG